MEAKWAPNDATVPQPASVAANLVGLEMQCGQHGLVNTAKKCARIKNDCHTRQVTFREIVSALKELRERFEDELHGELFLHVDPELAELYEKPTQHWQEIISRFPRVRHDIEEASKCFALERYAAALFHILLIAEFGVIKVAELFGVAGDKPGWAALDRLQRINDKKWNDKTALEQQHADF